MMRHLFAVLLSLSLAPVARAQVDLGLGAAAPAAEHAKWTFAFEPAKAKPGDTVELVASYEAAAGWHLYAPNFVGTGLATAVRVETPLLSPSGDATFPEPIVKKVVLIEGVLEETHQLLEGRGAIRQKLRVAADAPAGAQAVRVLLTFMTCSESTCDPPVKDRAHSVALEIVAAEGEAKDRSVDGTEPAPRGLLEPPIDLGAGIDLAPAPAARPGGTSDTKATWSFRVEPASVAAGGAFEIVAEYEVAEGWYTYAPGPAQIGVFPTSLGVESPHVTVSGAIAHPEPEIKDDEFTGPQKLLRGRGSLRLPLTVRALAEPGRIELPVSVRFATCKKNTCLLPATIERTLAFEITASRSAPSMRGDEPKSPDVVGAAESKAPAPTAAPPASGGLDDISGSSPLTLAILMFLGGLFALVMPCTYPMIPITISVFTKIAEARQGRASTVALAYGAGIIISFVVIGVVFAGIIQDFASNKWFNLTIGVLFFLFALSFFGVFTLRLPGAISNSLAGGFSGAGTYGSVFALGLTLCVTSFTCTAPIMGPLLVYATQEGASQLRVAGAMSVFGATMAAPFMLLALFPARVRAMPRSGEWMNTIKVALGFVELAASLKFLSSAERVWNNDGTPLEWLPREPFLLMWSVIFVAGGIYLLGLFRMKDEQPRGISGLRLLSAMLFFFLGLYFGWGATVDRTDWVTESQVPPYGRFEDAWTVDSLDEGIELATSTGKKMLVDFTGPTCSNCLAMERSVFPKFRYLLSKFVVVKLNTDDNPRQGENRAYQIELANTLSRPVYAIVDPSAPRTAIEIFDGADLPSGTRFGRFLERHAER